jgi:hypothetical protein
MVKPQHIEHKKSSCLTTLKGLFISVENTELLPEAIVFQREREFGAIFTIKEQHFNFSLCQCKHAIP